MAEAEVEYKEEDMGYVIEGREGLYALFFKCSRCNAKKRVKVI